MKKTFISPLYTPHAHNLRPSPTKMGEYDWLKQMVLIASNDWIEHKLNCLQDEMNQNDFERSQKARKEYEIIQQVLQVRISPSDKERFMKEATIVAQEKQRDFE